MQDQRILGLAYLIIIVAIVVQFPSFDAASQSSKKAWQVQINKGERIPIPSNELNTIAQSEFVKKQVRNGALLIRTEMDLNEDSMPELLLYKPLIKLQGVSNLPSQTLQVHRFTVLNSLSTDESQFLLDLRADGIFEGNREIIPVKTPVFAYQVIQEHIQKKNEKKSIIKVELLNADREVSSDQLVFYWDARLKRIEATNAFDPEKAFN
jgi:hypothetical protein